MTPQQEFDRLQQYFGALYHDPNYNPSVPHALHEPPFIAEQIRTQLYRLSITKALVPDDIPALV